MDQEKMNRSKAYRLAKGIVATAHKKLTSNYLDSKSTVCYLEGEAFYGEIPEKVRNVIDHLVIEEMQEVASLITDSNMLKIS